MIAPQDILTIMQHSPLYANLEDFCSPDAQNHDLIKCEAEQPLNGFPAEQG